MVRGGAGVRGFKKSLQYRQINPRLFPDPRLLAGPSFWSRYSASCFSWPCRGFGPRAFKNSFFFFFAVLKLPNRPSTEFRVVLSPWRSAHALEAGNPKPLPSQWDLLSNTSALPRNSAFSALLLPLKPPIEKLFCRPDLCS